MTSGTYEALRSQAAKLFKGNKTLYEYVNVFEPDDLVHEYVVSYKYDSELPIALKINDLKEYCYKLIRNAKRRKMAGTIITHSNNKMLDNFGENYRDDDIMDGYLYRNSALSDRVSTRLYEDSYRDIRRNIDKDKMLEDMQKIMLSKDRLMCITNTNNNRAYWVGNPMAIPIELLYSAQKYNTKERNLKDDGVG